jgi:hypothetical protein
MRPYSHLPKTNGESNQIGELLLANEDDLSPLITRELPAVTNAVDDTPSPQLSLTDVQHAALVVVSSFVSAGEAVFGWRHVLFVVSGIIVPPSRAERELREAARFLLSSVGSFEPDPAKEASS